MAQKNVQNPCETYVIRSTAIFDSVADAPEPAALLVSDGVIQAVLPWDYLQVDASGAPEELRAVPSAAQSLKDVPLFDYGNQLVMPSFVDAHTHLFSGAIVSSAYVCDTMGEGKSQEDCVRILKEYAEKHPGSDRIRGAGWFIGNWEDWTPPDKRSLDAAFPDRPVYLQCADGHNFWLNTRAIEEAGIVPQPDMKNGTVCTWENGELTGLLMEPAACAPALEKYMDFSDEQLRRILLEFQEVLTENGIAAVSEMSADGYGDDTYARYRVLKQLDEEGLLTADVNIYTELFRHTEFSAYFDMKKSWMASM